MLGSTAFAATDNDAGGIGSWPWPLIGEVVGDYRNGSDPYAAGQHRGVDIAAPAGTPARAVVAGTVSFSGKLPDGGQTVTIRTGEHLVSFLHLSRRNLTRGAGVSVGEVVGLVGTTGKRSTSQSHLHLGVRLASTRRYVDPMTLLGPKRLAEPVRSTPSPAPADIKPKVGTQRVGGERQVRVEPLEPAEGNRERGANRTAQPSSTAGSGAHDSTIVERSDQQSSRPSASLKAPPPLKTVDEAPTRTEAAPLAPVQHPEPTTASSVTTEDSAFPIRPLLLALAALALVALFANRRARSEDGSLPTEPGASDETVARDVVDDDRPLLRSVK